MRKWQIRTDRPESVAVLLFPRFSNHCLANAVEPLRAANDLAMRDLYRWDHVTLDGHGVTSSSGLPVVPDCRLDAHPGGTYLFVHSSYDFRQHASAANLAALRSAARRFDKVLGLDTGAWLMAGAGMLDGRRATIHLDELTFFAERFTSVRAVAERFVEDGPMITSGGATAAFDLVLDLIGRTHGEALKLEVAALFLQFGTAPPPDGQHRSGRSALVNRGLALMAARIEDPLAVADLARRLGQDQRALGRAFNAALGAPPKTVYRRLRLATARRLAEQTDYSIAEIALRCGYADPAAMTRAFVAEYGMPPSTFRRRQ